MIASRYVLRLATVVIILLTRAVICNPVERNFNVSSLRYEHKEAAAYLLWSKDVEILPTGFEGSLIYQLYATAKEMQMCEC